MSAAREQELELWPIANVFCETNFRSCIKGYVVGLPQDGIRHCTDNFNKTIMQHKFSCLF